MSDKDSHGWLQLELHARSREKRKTILEGMVPFLDSMGVRYYFNCYGSPRDHFIKLGLTEINNDTRHRVIEKAKEFNARVQQGNPDLRMEDDMVIDDIKELSTIVAVKNLHLKKLTNGQAYLFIHFLMNQLGYSYNEEMDTYLALAYNVRFGQRK